MTTLESLRAQRATARERFNEAWRANRSCPCPEHYKAAMALKERWNQLVHTTVVNGKQSLVTHGSMVGDVLRGPGRVNRGR